MLILSCMAVAIGLLLEKRVIKFPVLGKFLYSVLVTF